MSPLFCMMPVSRTLPNDRENCKGSNQCSRRRTQLILHGAIDGVEIGDRRVQLTLVVFQFDDGFGQGFQRVFVVVQGMFADVGRQALNLSIGFWREENRLFAFEESSSPYE